MLCTDKEDEDGDEVAQAPDDAGGLRRRKRERVAHDSDVCGKSGARAGLASPAVTTSAFHGSGASGRGGVEGGNNDERSWTCLARRRERGWMMGTVQWAMDIFTYVGLTKIVL